MYNLKFINFSSSGGSGESGYEYAHINPNYLILKSFYKIKSPENYSKINWTDPIIFQRMSSEEIVNIIELEKIDILCFALYVWTSSYSKTLMSLVKSRLPNIKIIVGGPDVYANIDDQYFEKYPFIDYAVYGDGESAFKEILDSIVESREISPTATNIITKTQRFDFKVFDDPVFKNVSPYIECKADLLNMMLDIFAEGYSSSDITIRYERARGCPYNCSFCDWNSGLHNKVKRKTNDWKDEIDLILSLGTRIKVTDANWGLYKEDIDITRYIIENGGRFIPSAVAKLNKDRVFEIFDILVKRAVSENRKQAFTIALQDIDENVLKNINRPEIPWADHKAMLVDFKNKYPNTALYYAELIVGLPGQTIDNFINQLHELKNTSFDGIYYAIWEFLPNSPAAKIEYQTQHNLEFKEFTVIQDGNVFNTIDDLNAAIKTGVDGYMITQRIVKTSSADFVDILIMYVMCVYYNQIAYDHTADEIRDILTKIYPKLRIEYEEHVKYMNTTGIFGLTSANHTGIMSIDQYCNKVATYDKYL